MKFPKKPDDIRSEAHFWLFVAANEGATTEIGMENAIDFDSLNMEL
jgi:hypothetical protein